MNKMKGIITIIISTVALIISVRACSRSDEIFKIQNTPRLSAQLSGESYVGSMPPRIDEVVTVPIIVSNNSDAFAYDVIIDLLISDGTGREVSLNDYFRSVNVPIMYKERMIPREQWIMIPPKAMSAPNNSRELYSTGKLTFKAKLQLGWKDVKGKKYKFVNLGELKYAHIKDGERSIESFWIDSKATYASYTSKDDKKNLDKNWGMNFNY